VRRAKAFLFVCVGLLLLTLSYHPGATDTVTPSASTPVASAFNATFSGVVLTFVINRTFYACFESATGTDNFRQTTIPQPVPGSSTIIATGSSGGGNYVLLENGDIYVAGNGADWVSAGNAITGGSVNVERHSLGELKQRYR